jgi:hypothetical protein
VDILTDDTELSTVRLPLTRELREYLVSCTDHRTVWPRLAGVVAGLGLWLLAVATGKVVFFMVGTIVGVLSYALAGSWKVSEGGAREDLRAGVFFKSTGWIAIEAEEGDGESGDYCEVDLGDRKLRLPVSVRDAEDIARVLREQPIFSRPDASPTSMLVWAEVLWLPGLGHLIAVRDGAGRVVYSDKRFWRSANL